MIDIRLIREKPALVKENMKKRFKDSKGVDEILEKDAEWRKLKGESDALRAERNKLSKEVAELKRQGLRLRNPTTSVRGQANVILERAQEPPRHARHFSGWFLTKAGKSESAALKKAQKIPEQIAEIEKRMKSLESERDALLLTIPNMLHETVPQGKDASQNVELRKWGKITKPTFELRNHAELIEAMGAVDFDAARANAGEGFNYLLGDMALLDHALQRYGIDFILKKGFTLVVPPLLLNFETLLGALNGLKDFEEVVYKIEKENLYLIGTAEHALVSLHKDRTLNKKDLPIKLCALTPCFRKEIGSHGVDTKGLFRMHQFNKVEQVVYCGSEDSFRMLEEMQKITEEFFQSLKIPYRVIELCSADLGAKFAKQYDIEAWFPRQGKYAEVTSAGNCTDYQSRALGIKYYDKEEKKHPHILNNTMVATSRSMVALLENYQQKDGSVKIPDVLVPYMHGKKVIGKQKYIGEHK